MGRSKCFTLLGNYSHLILQIQPIKQNIKYSGSCSGIYRWGYDDLSIEQTSGFHGMNIMVTDMQRLWMGGYEQILLFS